MSLMFTEGVYQINSILFIIILFHLHLTEPIFLLNIANYQKTPTILNIHGLLQMENAYEPKRLAHLIWLDCFNSLKRVDRVVVNSEYMKQMIAYFYRLNTEKIVVIPNGIDFEKFSSCTSQTKLAGDPAVLSVSRVCILKGFGTIVDAILQLKQELPNIKVHLIGYATKEYLDLAKRKGVEKFLVFHGKVPHSLVPMYLKSADFGIYGSILYEGFGISLVEAMAAGLPVIASDIDTYRQIVSDGQDGLLFERSNAEELSKAILTMSKDLNLRRKLSQNAQITTARYDWGNIAEEYLSLYRTISNRNS